MSERERAAVVLVGTVLWAGLWALVAGFYQTGVDRGAHPAKYGYIWWYDWTVVALAPIILGCLIVTVLVAKGRSPDHGEPGGEA